MMTPATGQDGIGAAAPGQGVREGLTQAAPRFSVIIPCFNAETTLSETLSSLAEQSFTDFEAIILDDGSSDGSATIAADFAARDARFRLVRLQNGGPSRARNIGAYLHASAELIAFLDSDDLFAPEKLARMAERFAAPDAPDAVYARIAFFRGAPESARTISTILRRPLEASDLLRENAVCTMSNIVVRADRFRMSGGFKPALVHGEDVDWLIRMVAGGARIEGLDETLVYYRTSDGGLSSDLDAMRRGWHAARLAAEATGARLTAREVRSAEAGHWRYLARRALRMNAPRSTAFRLALRGIACSPLGFFDDVRRGGLTLAASIAGLVLPTATRRRLFS